MGQGVGCSRDSEGEGGSLEGQGVGCFRDSEGEGGSLEGQVCEGGCGLLR